MKTPSKRSAGNKRTGRATCSKAWLETDVFENQIQVLFLDTHAVVCEGDVNEVVVPFGGHGRRPPSGMASRALEIRLGKTWPSGQDQCKMPHLAVECTIATTSCNLSSYSHVIFSLGHIAPFNTHGQTDRHPDDEGVNFTLYQLINDKWDLSLKGGTTCAKSI